MDLRYGRNHISCGRWPWEKPLWTSLVGLIADTKPPTWGHHFWRHPGILYSLSMCRFPLMRFTPSQRKGNEFRLELLQLPTQWELLVLIPPWVKCHWQNTTHTMGMSFSLEASPSDPILRSGLPEWNVREPFPQSQRPGKPKDGGGIRNLLLLGVAKSSDWVLLSNGPPMSVSSPSWERKQDGAMFLVEAVKPLISQVYIALISRGSFPLLK